MRYRTAVVAMAGCVALAALGASISAAGAPRPGAGASLAQSMCYSAFGSKVVNSTYGDVATARTMYVPATNGFTGGLYTPAQKTARSFHDTFPRLSRTATTAWCWTGETNDYKLYVIAAGYKPVLVESRVGAEYRFAPHPVGTSTIYGQP